MTMFNRNDKAGDTSAAATAGTTATPAATPAPVAPPRPQTQPLASSSGGSSVSVISKALKITGQLESTEDIQIEGEIEGLSLIHI